MNLTAQYSHKYISDYTDRLESNKNTALATFGLTKMRVHGILVLSSFGYFDLTNKGMFNRTSADYAVSDEIHILAGYDRFGGDEGVFALYRDNSEVRVKARFSF
jgi:hypothetical protein